MPCVPSSGKHMSAVIDVDGGTLELDVAPDATTKFAAKLLISPL